MRGVFAEALKRQGEQAERDLARTIGRGINNAGQAGAGLILNPVVTAGLRALSGVTSGVTGVETGTTMPTVGFGRGRIETAGVDGQGASRGVVTGQWQTSNYGEGPQPEQPTNIQPMHRSGTVFGSVPPRGVGVMSPNEAVTQGITAAMRENDPAKREQLIQNVGNYIIQNPHIHKVSANPATGQITHTFSVAGIRSNSPEEVVAQISANIARREPSLAQNVITREELGLSPAPNAPAMPSRAPAAPAPARAPEAPQQLEVISGDSAYGQALGKMALANLMHTRGNTEGRDKAIQEARDIIGSMGLDGAGSVNKPAATQTAVKVNGHELRYQIQGNLTPEQTLAQMATAAAGQHRQYGVPTTPVPAAVVKAVVSGQPTTPAAPAVPNAGAAAVLGGVAGVEEQKLVNDVAASIARAQTAKGNPIALNALASQVPAAAAKGAQTIDGVKLHDLTKVDVMVPNKDGALVPLKKGFYTPEQLTTAIMTAMGAEPEVVTAVNARMGVKPATDPNKRVGDNEPRPDPAHIIRTSAPATTPPAGGTPAPAAAPAKVEEKLPTIELKKGGTEHVAKVQQTLESLGFATDAGGAKDGKVDGIAGKFTTEAVRKAEQVLINAGKLPKGAVADGKIDDDFIKALEEAKKDPKLKAALEEASGKKTAAAPVKAPPATPPAATPPASSTQPAQSSGVFPQSILIDKEYEPTLSSSQLSAISALTLAMATMTESKDSKVAVLKAAEALVDHNVNVDLQKLTYIDARGNKATVDSMIRELDKEVNPPAAAPAAEAAATQAARLPTRSPSAPTPQSQDRDPASLYALGVATQGEAATPEQQREIARIQQENDAAAKPVPLRTNPAVVADGIIPINKFDKLVQLFTQKASGETVPPDDQNRLNALMVELGSKAPAVEAAVKAEMAARAQQAKAAEAPAASADPVQKPRVIGPSSERSTFLAEASKALKFGDGLTDNQIIEKVEARFAGKPGVVRNGELDASELSMVAKKVDELGVLIPDSLKQATRALVQHEGGTKTASGGYEFKPLQTPAAAQQVAQAAQQGAGVQ